MLSQDKPVGSAEALSVLLQVLVGFREIGLLVWMIPPVWRELTPIVGRRRTTCRTKCPRSQMQFNCRQCLHVSVGNLLFGSMMPLAIPQSSVWIRESRAQKKFFDSDKAAGIWRLAKPSYCSTRRGPSDEPKQSAALCTIPCALYLLVIRRERRNAL